MIIKDFAKMCDFAIVLPNTEISDSTLPQDLNKGLAKVIIINLNLGKTNDINVKLSQLAEITENGKLQPIEYGLERVLFGKLLAKGTEINAYVNTYANTPIKVFLGALPNENKEDVSTCYPIYLIEITANNELVFSKEKKPIRLNDYATVQLLRSKGLTINFE